MGEGRGDGRGRGRREEEEERRRGGEEERREGGEEEEVRPAWLNKRVSRSRRKPVGHSCSVVQHASSEASKFNMARGARARDLFRPLCLATGGCSQ